MDEKAKAVKELKQALDKIKKCKNFTDLIPEVGTNIAYALKDAKDIEEVAAVPGRIRNAMGKPVFLNPKFGGSRHMACAVLSIMEFDKEKKCAMNIKYDEKVLNVCKKMGLTVSFYDRRDEPEELKGKEGESLPWGIEQAVKKAGKVTDIIYDLGDWGKEPVIKIIGKNPKEVVDIVVSLVQNFILH